MILAIIQARVGSSRLPNKVLHLLEDKTVLEHVISRVRRSKYINEVFVATTIDKNNLPLIELCSSQNIRVFCGSEDDVLDRFYQLAKLIHPDHIVRITSDCPAIDPEVIDMIIMNHLESKSDYTSNTIIDSFPDGLDTEIFTFSSLEKSWKEAVLLSEREHVTPYLKKHPEIFSLKSIVCDINLAVKRWTIDTESDYEFFKSVFNELYAKNPFFGMDDILQLLEKKPELEIINANIIRNEGYLKSVMNDKEFNL
jgi:spore coat polysaccharide biosynthesis protein SpsF (cytidylyltransferase family)